MLAGRNGFKHQCFGDAVAANEFHHNVDIGVGNDLARITDHFDMGGTQSLSFGNIQIGHHANFNATSSTAFDFFLIALQYIECATAYGAHP